MAVGLSLIMLASLLQAMASPSARAEGNGWGELPELEQPVDGEDGLDVIPRTVEEGPRVPQTPPRAAWPDAGSEQVTLPSSARSAAPVPAGDLPVRLSPGGGSEARADSARVTAQVQILDREASQDAGVNGVLLTVEGEEDSVGAVEVELNYTGFAGAFGGGYGSRLTFVQLPTCVVDTPEAAECREQTPAPSVNDTETETLTATGVEVTASGPVVLAAVADEEGVESDYTATALASSATWDVGLNTGDFAWSYDMPVPDVPGSLTPNVGLSYSSGSIDGRTGGTNNQASWAGDGFDLWPGYIERTYQSCAEEEVENADGNKVGDLCWEYDNAFISFNGRAGELVPAGDNEWKFQQDDGTRIRRLTSGERANGDNDNEYWEMTTPEGIRYYFGYHRLPGWTSGKETTDSTWTVPVYGNDTGEPCRAATVAASSCTQAWRWNLDYAVDARGNAIAYYYNKEENSYGRFLDETDDVRYTRGGTLDRVEYGLRENAMYSARALARVDFAGSTRCLPQDGVDCAASAIDDNELYWYDTPWDLNCEAGTDCDSGRSSPTFWTRNRLTQVTTEVLASGAYQPVDSWSLTHRWGMADVDYQLLLDSVQRTGHTATPAITLPKTTFAYQQLPNRLDELGDGYAPFNKERLATVADEYGGQIDVQYSGEACDPANLPTPETNTTRCFPQYIGGGGDITPDLEWFNKYVVTGVIGTDRTGRSPDQVTEYRYPGDAAWHFDDDNGLVPEEEKTWSQWRGYGHVRTLSGGEGDIGMLSQEDTYFLRGMHGDRLNEDGGTKDMSVALPAGEGDPIIDHPAVHGFAYRTVTYDGVDGDVLEKSVSRPWHHETASDVRDWGTITADLSGTARTTTWTSLDDGAGSRWRTTRVDTAYDTVAGRPTEVNDLADTATSADDRCTRTTYATGTDANLLTLPARAETVAVACTATPDRADDVITDERWAYDGGDYGEAPTAGDVTATAVLKDHDGTTAGYLESGATYDSYGRQVSTTDLTADLTVTGSTLTRSPRGDGRTSTVAYSPATGFPTQTTSTDPPVDPDTPSTAMTEVTQLDPVRGVPTRLTDTNSKVTVLSYDALGRSEKVWLADRRTGMLPSYQFTYHIEENEPVVVGTRTLDNAGNNQLASYTVYDGFLRERQTQEPGPDGGRLVADRFYDERGLLSRTFVPYYALGAPARELFLPDEPQRIESQTRHAYDALGREIETRQIAGDGDGGEVLGTTTTSYHGDRVTVIPPLGATATTTLTDARGQMTELRQHHERSADADFDSTQYTQTPSGQIDSVTDPAGNEWTYAYDQLGRTVATTDPDAGRSESAFNDRGELTTRTNARDITLAYAYDGLGRQTALREGSAEGPLRAEWVYDTITGARGQLAKSIRYHDGEAYTTEVTSYDRLYRPLTSRITIPETEQELGGTYEHTTRYHASGLTQSMALPAVGGQPGNGVAFTYEAATLRPTELAVASGPQVLTTYHPTGRYAAHDIHDNGDPVVRATYEYEWGTQRLAATAVQRWEGPFDRRENYTYDQAGNVLSIADTSATGTDVQCFQYDYLRRLTEAWAQTATTCAPTPSGGTMGGPAPYWHSYTYDAVGNRLTETLHEQDTERVYDYPEPGAAQPHTLTSVVEDAPGIRSLEEYTYDPTGNTATRQVGGDTQELTWDAEGHLASVEEANGEITEYLYDADGQRLIGRTPTETTLYLGDHTEVTLPAGSTTPTATRYIALGGGHTAVIADDESVSITMADHHGTGQLAIDTANLELTQRRTLPFGDYRGDTPGTWPGTRGFVGGTTDTSTGLTHLGAREYDPALGRFISVDPVMDLTDPQQIHGYTYANNNPLAFSDPTGLFLGGFFDAIASAAKKAAEAAAKAANSAARNGNGGGRSRGGAGRSGSSSQNVGWDPPGDWPDAGDVSEFLEGAYKGVVPPEVRFFLPDPWNAYEECSGNLFSSSCGESLLDYIPFGKFNKLKKLYEKLKGAPQETPSPSRADTPCNSFTPGAPVLMADGSTEQIEDVEIGDVVLTTDPETGETSPRTVTAELTSTGTKDLTTLTIAPIEGAPTTITATDQHPFWAPDLNTWLDAADLTPGTSLLTSTGTLTTVTAVTHTTTTATVHNLTVEGTHTYHVLAGEVPVLVHNCPKKNPNPGPPPIPNIVHGGVEDILQNGRPQRLNPDGTPDVFTPRPNTPNSISRRWGGAAIYDIDGGGNRYRILVNRHGNVGWVDNHDYTKIYPYQPRE
ncbi:polymorphic toxin-type HINT domain-containing protein [Streptomyces sp. SBT349]|uniref:polymorphic toxin-type HINT domain-containing protein n=1 Tax=Streptomyces sp. SBT349 TaxID=1580539 RepID=UPI00069E460D|nr:polymorphic toxin-type HINT domain-containing protein [Streptomyces sp. SBT349]